MIYMCVTSKPVSLGFWGYIKYAKGRNALNEGLKSKNCVFVEVRFGVSNRDGKNRRVGALRCVVLRCRA